MQKTGTKNGHGPFESLDDAGKAVAQNPKSEKVIVHYAGHPRTVERLDPRSPAAQNHNNELKRFCANGPDGTRVQLVVRNTVC